MSEINLKVRYTDHYKSLNLPPLVQPRDGDAGYDLRSMIGVHIKPGHLVEIPTGVHVAIPGDYVGLVKDRSSMAKRGTMTSGGVIDSGYRGEIVILLRNHNPDTFVIEAGERVAQLILVRIATPPVVETTDLGETERGEGGFGSTGQH